MYQGISGLELWAPRSQSGALPMSFIPFLKQQLLTCHLFPFDKNIQRLKYTICRQSHCPKHYSEELIYLTMISLNSAQTEDSNNSTLRCIFHLQMNVSMKRSTIKPEIRSMLFGFHRSFIFLDKLKTQKRVLKQKIFCEFDQKVKL